MRCTRNFRAVDLAVGLLMVAEMVLLMVATATWPEQRVPAAPSRMDLHLVDGSRTGAVCMDGTWPGFYLRQGNSTDNWLVYLEGGGWVYDKASAVSRSKGGLGSSQGWPQTMEAQGMLSADSRENPDLAHFNVAFFKYCDGFCFSGNNETAMVHGSAKPVLFRGRRILDRLLDELLQRHGLRQAKTVLLAGSSAGGLAVYMHADHVGTILRSAAPQLVDYRAIADAGWFPDILDVNSEPGLRPVVQWVSKLANSSGNQACLVTMRAVHPRTWPSSCFMANEAYPFVRTPLFIMEPLYGTHNLFDTIGLGCTPPGTVGSPRPFCNSSQMVSFFSLRDRILAQFQSLGVLSSPTGGAFAPSCICHGQTGSNHWDNLNWTVPSHSENTNRVVLGRWLNKRGKAESWKAVDAQTPWPNNEGCWRASVPAG